MNYREEFLKLDDRLAKKGVHPLTPWWREGIGTWLDLYSAGDNRELVAAVGRGGAKSFAMLKLALFFMLFGPFEVPLAEMHFAIILSRLKEEAAKGIAIADGWLHLLGVPHRLAGDVIEIPELRRGIRVAAASVAAASGWRALFVGKDERSKWPASGIEERDAEEIDTSAGAMTATHASAAVRVTFSSAWVKGTSFDNTVSAGTDAAHVVLGPVPTWVAAPHLREEDLHKLERDPRKFDREYRCVSSSSVSSALDVEAVDRGFLTRLIPASMLEGRPVITIDASRGHSDAWTWCLARWIVPPSTQFKMRQKYVPGSATVGRVRYVWDYVLDEKGRRIELEDSDVCSPILRVEWVKGIDGKFWKQVSADKITTQVAKDALAVGAPIIGDQCEAFALTSLFAQRGARFTYFHWTNPSKVEAMDTLRRWLRDEQLWLPQDAQLRQEMLDFEEEILPSGAITFGARGKKHDDRVALLLTLAHAENAGLLDRSPLVVPQRRDLANLPPR